jgi:hypothetical protein
VATASGRINQRHLAKPCFDEIVEIAERFSARDFCVGTCLGRASESLRYKKIDRVRVDEVTQVDCWHLSTAHDHAPSQVLVVDVPVQQRERGVTGGEHGSREL